MNEVIKRQIMSIQETGRTNMFDSSMVQAIANRMRYYELVIYIEHHPLDYLRFILTGKTEDDL